MSRLLAIVIIAAVAFGGWKVYSYWSQMQNDEELERQKRAALVIVPEQLPGMPGELEASLQTATKLGVSGLRNWLKAYDAKLQDPRKAYIQLDFCVLVSQENPAEARRLFAEVKSRTPQSSPIWPRIKQLEKAYE